MRLRGQLWGGLGGGQIRYFRTEQIGGAVQKVMGVERLMRSVGM